MGTIFQLFEDASDFQQLQDIFLQTVSLEAKNNLQETVLTSHNPRERIEQEKYRAHCACTYICIYVSTYLSLSIYICINIYIEREVHMCIWIGPHSVLERLSEPYVLGALALRSTTSWLALRDGWRLLRLEFGSVGHPSIDPPTSLYRHRM